MTKSELISKMKEHQQEYAKYASELKALSAAEEQKVYQERQLARLEEYKSKYTLFVKEDGSLKEIDWAEIETLVKTSFNQSTGYALGFDQTGMEGLACDYGNGSVFSPMVEDEVEADRFISREKRRREFIARSKGQK